jgi:plastocyanin
VSGRIPLAGTSIPAKKIQILEPRMTSLLFRSFGAAALALALIFLASPAMSRLPAGRLFAAQAVDTGDYYFAPASLTIKAGDTVVWTNSGGEAHTVTADDGSWGTDDLEPGASFSHSFPRPGTYTYSCVIHDGQSGTITVQ